MRFEFDVPTLTLVVALAVLIVAQEFKYQGLPEERDHWEGQAWYYWRAYDLQQKEVARIQEGWGEREAEANALIFSMVPALGQCPYTLSNGDMLFYGPFESGWIIQIVKEKVDGMTCENFIPPR